MLKDKFYGRFLLRNATALIYFQKGELAQELLHNLKYRGKKEISSFFGKWLGAELAENNFYKDVAVVIPVPLHKQKLKKRGYNQVEGFGKEIALALNVPYRDDILIKISKSGSQVFKTRMLRFEAEEVFSIQNLDAIKDKHVLLVDDIITTGATLEKCALQLLKGENVSISTATIATT
jgi:ComF family protein